MLPSARFLLSTLLLSAGSIGAGVAADLPTGDVARGNTTFQQSCSNCHADHSGPGNADIVKLGPSLVGVFGRRAGTSSTYNYSKAMTESGLTWDAPNLDHFLANPTKTVPGTTMPTATSSEEDRRNVIAYLATLKKAEAPVAAPATPPPAPGTASEIGDWRQAAPGVKYHFTVADLPAPFATPFSGNGPRVVKPPTGASPSVPTGFTVKLFASGMANPRVVRVAPNGDIFVAETGPSRIRILRAADGLERPTENRIFAEKLDHPFGIAFYPPGDNPQWIYFANDNSVVRFPYQNGDLKVRGEAQVIVPQLARDSGGHSTRDIAFSKDGKRLFISVGSGSNVAESMSKKSVEEAKRWEAEHGKGAAWDSETNRADILVTDPEGHEPLHTFATGIRNGVGLAVNELTGDLWTSTNERDGLGDDLVPEYITRVKEGGYYGWPWYYIGNHEDPRLKGDRPDLAGQAIVPDVLMQSHSATLEMVFYTAKTGSALFPAEYHGDVFAAFHGSWNRSTRTGYKVVRVRVKDGVPTGEYEDFLTGFVADDRSVWGRPVGVAIAHDGALLVTEDGNNTLWRIAPVEKSK